TRRKGGTVSDSLHPERTPRPAYPPEPEAAPGGPGPEDLSTDGPVPTTEGGEDGPDPAPAGPGPGLPRRQQPAKGRRLARAAGRPASPLTPAQRLLVLDAWRRSGLPLGGGRAEERACGGQGAVPASGPCRTLPPRVSNLHSVTPGAGGGVV